MISLLMGILTICLAVLGFLHWPANFPIFLKYVVPVCFAAGGSIAVIAGLSTFRK